jgi:hypothetical protein
MIALLQEIGGEFSTEVPSPSIRQSDGQEAEEAGQLAMAK